MFLKKRWIVGILFIILIIAIRYFNLNTYISFPYIKQHYLLLESFIEQHYISSVLFFIFLYIAVITFAIPVSPMLNIAAGSLFYLIPGTIYCVMGATLGATLSFLLIRYAFGNWMQQKYGYRLKKFNTEFKERGANYLLFLQLLPLTPFFVIIIISGLSEISWWTFFWTTAVGITPGTMVYVFAGKQFATISHPSDILSFPIIAAFSALALISLVPVFVRLWQNKYAKS